MSGVQAAPPVGGASRRHTGEEPDLGLFTEGGPFESFPGPVLVVGRNGMVLGANGPAEPLARLLRGGAPRELQDAVQSALSGRAAQVSPLLLSADRTSGQPARAYDLMALPWADAPAALLLARDITLERSLRAALVESRQLYKDLIEACADFVWETDREGLFTYVSDQGALGYAAQELVGLPVAGLLLIAGDIGLTPFAARAPVRKAEIWFKDREGHGRCLEVMALPLFDGAGEWAGCRGFCREATGRREGAQAAGGEGRSDSLFAYMMRNAMQEFVPQRVLSRLAEDIVRSLPLRGVAILRRNEEGRFVSECEEGETLPEALRERLLLDQERQPQAEQVEAGAMLLPTLFRGLANGTLLLWHRHEAPEWREEERAALEQVQGQIAFFLEALKLESELLQLSATDALTGLANRRGFLDSLERRVERAIAGSEEGALFFLDIDDFKGLNDSRGHGYGDRVLRCLADLLTGLAREGDLIGRLGGDEFALFVPHIGQQAAAEKAAELCAAAQAAGNVVAPFSLSVGVACLEPGRAESVEALMIRADKAMYAMKHAGRTRQAPLGGDAA